MEWFRSSRARTGLLAFFLIFSLPSAQAFERLSCPASGYGKETYPGGPFEKDLLRVATALHDAKSDQELNRYFRCWGDPGKYEIYSSAYREMIHDAAKAANIPFEILACLIFYESKFDKDVVSPVGAKGLGQIMPGTWKDIKKDLDPALARVGNPFILANLTNAAQNTTDPEIKDAIQKIRKIYYPDGDNQPANTQIRAIEDLKELDAQLDRLAKHPTYPGRNFVREYTANVNVALNRYYTQEVYRNYWKARGKTGVKPDLFDAEYSIIMSAIRLRRVYKDLFDLKLVQAKKNHWIAAVGGYNVGPGAIKCKATTSIDACIQLAPNPETKGHMIGIRNCAEKGNWNDKTNAPKIRTIEVPEKVEVIEEVEVLVPSSDGSSPKKVKKQVKKTITKIVKKTVKGCPE